MRILCLGAHSDDIEIGCGGAVLRILEKYQTEVRWVVFSGHGQRGVEARHCAELFLARAQGKQVTIHNFRDSFFPYEGKEIKETFEVLKHEFTPDLIFTHYRNDLHQDHRIICELTWNTWRNHMILEYEVPKYDGDMGQPNFFVPLGENVSRTKIQNILQTFQSQANKHWLDEQTFLAMLRIRGMESNSPEKYAEGFYCRKMLLDVERICPAEK